MNTTKTLNIGQTVTHHRFGAGIVIAVDEKNTTVDFPAAGVKTLITAFAFPTADTVNAYAEKKAAKDAAKARRRQRDAEAIARFDAQPNAKKIEAAIMWCNGKVQGDRTGQGWLMCEEMLLTIDEIAQKKGDFFICDVIKSVVKYMRATDKQAFVIARFADLNGYVYA